MNVKLYNQEGAEVGTVELKPEIFDIEPNQSVVHQYVVAYLARQRQGTVQTKTRRDISGGGRKPWRQKGTGRARAGTIRSPLWRGGGTVFGPHPRQYKMAMPKQMKRLAIRSVFAYKAQSDRIRVLDKIEFGEIKTRRMVDLLKRFQLDDKKCIILDDAENRTCQLACRNIPGVIFSPAIVANGYDVLNAEYVVLTRAGLDKLQEVFG